MNCHQFSHRPLSSCKASRWLDALPRHADHLYFNQSSNGNGMALNEAVDSIARTHKMFARCRPPLFTVFAV